MKLISARRRSASARRGRDSRSQDPLQHLSGANAIPGVDVVLGRCDASAPGLVDAVGRCQLIGSHQELRGGFPGAPPARHRRATFKRASNPFVRPGGGSGKMARLFLRITHKLRETSVDDAPTRPRSGLIDGRRIQRVGEGDPVAINANQAALLGGCQTTRGRRLFDEPDGRARERRGSEQGLTRLCRKLRHTVGKSQGPPEPGAGLPVRPGEAG